MSILAFVPLWTSQISIHTMDMSDLGETLMTQCLEASEMLSKIWFCFRTTSILLDVRRSWKLLCG